MYKSILHIVIGVLLTTGAISQEYSYVHYDTRDGLAGSTVYDMCQDKEGFMWFATENGLSRYDGTNFKNFTISDGLPDNEVLKVFCDSKGRVWISTFSKFICYYFNGKIYTKENNNVVSQMNFKNNIVTMAEDSEGNVAFCDLTNIIWIITPDNKIRWIDVLKKTQSKFLRFVSVFFVYDQNKKNIIISINDTNYYYKNNQLYVYSRTSKKFYFYQQALFPVYRHPLTHENKYISSNFDPINVIYNGVFLTYITSANGCYSIDTSKNALGTYFLPGKKISYVLEDHEENTWFSTLGDGLFKLPSKQFKTYAFNHISNVEAFSINKTGSSISIGTGFSTLYMLEGKEIKKMDFSSRLKFSETKIITNRLLSIKNLSDGSIILGFDSYLIKLKDKKTIVNAIPAIKSICGIDKGSILIGTARGAFVVSNKTLKVIDTIWSGRCTKVFYYCGKFYIGTLNGLFEVNKDKSSTFLGDLHPSLQRRITDIIVTADSTFWISIHDRGIIGIKNHKVKTTLSAENGLSSDNCKTLFFQNSFLWAGTNKGICKIDINNTTYPVTQFSISDGLVSDIINAIYVEDSMVYACTSAGLTYFNEKQIRSNSKCILKILKTQVLGKEMLPEQAKQLSYNQNNISFDFVGISFKSGGDITYRYQLEGLNDKWIETHQNTITYPVLPSGDYKFNLIAINKFGVKSQPYSFSFSIATPWWRTVWFWSLMIVLLTAVLWYIINLRYKLLNKRKEEKADFKQQIADLEQLALRAQMNPHFIFNCLNSIQNFIINQDLVATNRYLNNFARLLRQTLDQSTRKVISISEEITYISTYIDLEKMRFGNKFVYRINVGENIPPDFTFIPNMILQPFVENSIRHGILYRKEDLGFIEIDFTQTLEALICTVKDNGIGRKKSLALKTAQHIEYQSKGMQLTFNRLNLLGGDGKEKVTTIISDLAPDDKKYPGTLVQIMFPLSIIDKLNKQR